MLRRTGSPLNNELEIPLCSRDFDDGIIHPLMSRESPKNQKVFCIGFHKTGTSSLGSALKILGYSVTGPNGVRDPNISSNVYAMAYELVERYDAFQDNPWPLLYRDLDKRYPGSKFILTLRQPEQWIRSQVRHFGTRETPMRRWIYGKGSPEGNEAIYLERFEAHNTEVLSYFRDRPNDLLVMDVTSFDGWPQLCSFLDVAIPPVPFPHANSADKRMDNSVPLRRLRRLAAKIIPK